MYLRKTTQKRVDGTTLSHLQIAENVWDPVKKRSRVRILYNCGRADDEKAVERLRRLARSILKRCSPEELARTDPDIQVLGAWTYGDLYVLEQLWERSGLAEVVGELAQARNVGFPLERALFALVAHRALAPASKLHCHERWLAEEVRIEGCDALGLHHLYRAMDILEEEKEEIEKAVYFRLADLFEVDVDLIFYDTTSVHFEIDDQDPEGEGLARRRGFSKNGRGDAAQVVVGLAVTRDGFPVRHWVFSGNTVDVSTVAEVKEDLRGWRLTRCVFVGDAGMVSKENLRKLSRGGGRYIVCVPVQPGGKIDRKVLGSRGRYREVGPNLRVKEVVLGEGERRERYAVCHNPREAKRRRRHRAEVLAELEAKLAALSSPDGGGHSKQVCELRSSGRYRRYLRLTRGGKLRINRGGVKAAERLDGKFVVHTNDDTLTADDMALGYRQLQRVEQAWRRMKSGLGLRPIYHRAERRIRAHVALTVLALLLERIAERMVGDTWRNIRHDLAGIKLVELLGPNGTIRQVTEPRPGAAKRLKALEIAPPPPILRVD